MRTTEEIYNELLETMEGDGFPVTEGGDMALRLKALAAQLFALESESRFVLNQSFPQTAVGGYLDDHAHMRGISRRSAQYAEGKLRFWLNEQAAMNVPIPLGTECGSADGRSFVTLEEGVIPKGSMDCLVAARAVTGGKEGNVAPGKVVYIKNSPAGVSGVTNPETFHGGADAESDEELRQRVVATYKTLPNGANVAYYQQTVCDIDGVAACVVTPRVKGIGSVGITFSTTEGIPNDVKIQEVRDLLDSQREICVDIYVSTPKAVNVDINALVSIEEGYDKAKVIGEVKKAMQEHFSGKLLGKTVYLATLTKLVMDVAGVENCVFTSPVGDTVCGESQLPVLNSLNVSEG